jgi:hypothetical protein
LSKTGKEHGTCKLTGAFGKFVDSHLLPKALTRPSEKGAPLLEGTRGQGFKRRWSSWSDKGLVTAEGEAVLGRIDDSAIRVLRKYQLIWSSWVIGPPYFKCLAPLLPSHSVRDIVFDDPSVLWRYAISLVWRAAASSNYAVEDFELPPDRLERARRYTSGELTVDFADFPVTFVQLSTKGVTHNHSPMLDLKELPDLSGGPTRSIPMGRFYMDGLIIHVHLDALDRSIRDYDVFLGAKRTSVSCVTYEASFQYDNLVVLGYESVFGAIGRA